MERKISKMSLNITLVLTGSLREAVILVIRNPSTQDLPEFISVATQKNQRLFI
jgi:hypothetical protein